jgi:hypothetical protein
MGRFSLSQIFKTIDAERHAPLPAYGHRYFDQVLAEYHVSGRGQSSPPSYIDEIVKKHDAEKAGTSQPGQELTWADLYVLEKYVLRNQPLETLRRRAWALRSKYREIVGQRAYDAYLDSKPPNENQADLTADVLRVDLERLLDGLHWNYSLVPIRERMRTSVLKFIGLWLATVFVVVVVLLYLSATARQTDQLRQGYDLIATMLLVAFAGAVGGFVSLQRRIQTIPTEGDPLVSIFELENGLFSLYLAPLSGAIFALVLFFVFVAGFLRGTIFPDIQIPSLSIENFSWTSPRIAGPAFAMLMVWSFVAGFAERFVPDTLTRLVERGRESTTSSNTPAPPAPPFPPGGSPPAPARPPRPVGSPPFS